MKEKIETLMTKVKEQLEIETNEIVTYFTNTFLNQAHVYAGKFIVATYYRDDKELVIRDHISSRVQNMIKELFRLIEEEDSEERGIIQ